MCKTLVTAHPEGLTLAFLGEATVPHAQALHRAFVDLLPAKGNVILELSAVEACDVSFLQLLHAAKESFNHQGRLLKVSEDSIPETVKKCLDRSGVNLALPGETPICSAAA